MAIDVMYTNGVIAAREKFLLKDKIFRFSELSAEEAFRAILETGYGQGAEGVTDVYSFEKLVVAEERAVDAFIAEYAPNRSVVAYLLAPRDFHNAKAILKAKYLGVGFDNMLGSEGEICISVLSDCIMSGDYSKLAKQNQILASAIEDAQNLLNDGETSGAKIGDVFERAAYCYYAVVVIVSVCLIIAFGFAAFKTNLFSVFAGEPRTGTTDGYTTWYGITDEQREEVQKMGLWLEGILYKLKIAKHLGLEDDNFTRMTLQEAKQLVEENKEKGFEAIAAAFYKRQPYPDLQGGFNNFISEYWLDDEGTELIRISSTFEGVSYINCNIKVGTGSYVERLYTE